VDERIEQFRTGGEGPAPAGGHLVDDPAQPRLRLVIDALLLNSHDVCPHEAQARAGAFQLP
jgi:hypothetical protein